MDNFYGVRVRDIESGVQVLFAESRLKNCQIIDRLLFIFDEEFGFCLFGVQYQQLEDLGHACIFSAKKLDQIQRCIFSENLWRNEFFPKSFVSPESVIEIKEIHNQELSLLKRVSFRQVVGVRNQTGLQSLRLGRKGLLEPHSFLDLAEPVLDLEVTTQNLVLVLLGDTLRIYSPELRLLG